MTRVQNRSEQEAPDKKIIEKTDDARTLKGKILNVDFLLTVWIS